MIFRDVRESMCTVCVHIRVCMCSCPFEMHTRVQSVMRLVILLADMRKGQECHFVPRGCLSKRVGHVATGDEVKESPGR